MFPFIFSWLSFLFMPFLYCISKKNVLRRLNEVAFKIVFSSIGIIILAVFMAVNFAMFPIAYIKTVIHKGVIFHKYRGSEFGKNLLFFMLLGIPFLLCSQVTDVYHFMKHTFKSKQQQQNERLYEEILTLADFTKFLNKLEGLIEKNGIYQMKAI